jgi:hypothetical protein
MGRGAPKEVSDLIEQTASLKVHHSDISPSNDSSESDGDANLTKRSDRR